jgi:hypothetical protein
MALRKSRAFDIATTDGGKYVLSKGCNAHGKHRRIGSGRSAHAGIDSAFPDILGRLPSFADTLAAANFGETRP